jgi:hypothetical protein
MMTNYESDDDKPLISHLPSHIFSKLIMRDYESDDDKPLIKSVVKPKKKLGPRKKLGPKKKMGRPPKKIIVMTEAQFSAEYDSEDEPLIPPPAYDSDDEPLMRYSTPKEYDSDDEPLMRYSTPKEYDSDDDKPLMPPPTAFAPVHQYTTINIRANDDTDDVNYHYLLIDRQQQRKRRWNMIKKSCRRKRTMSEKWRDMRAVLNIRKRKDKQDRAKVLMGKYGFKIKGWYNMNKKMLECEVARALWK